jgi:hypothetical protein
MSFPLYMVLRVSIEIWLSYRTFNMFIFKRPLKDLSLSENRTLEF